MQKVAQRNVNVNIQIDSNFSNAKKQKKLLKKETVNCPVFFHEAKDLSISASNPSLTFKIQIIIVFL